MPDYTETVTANKYHFDSGYKIQDISKDAFRLTNENNDIVYLPKSQCRDHDKGNGNTELLIKGWWYGKNKSFFIK